MALSLTQVRFYTALDPYLYSVDNRPLEDLEARDNDILGELDRRTHPVDIASDGSVNYLPGTWNRSFNGTGDKTITHNLGHSNYVVSGLVVDPNGGIISVVSFDNTTVRVKTWSVTGTLADRGFHLTINEHPASGSGA